MSMGRPNPPMKLYWVTIKMEAAYSLLVPDVSQVEAIIRADERAVLLMKLEDVEKDVVQIDKVDAK